MVNDRLIKVSSETHERLDRIKKYTTETHKHIVARLSQEEEVKLWEETALAL